MDGVGQASLPAGIGKKPLPFPKATAGRDARHHSSHRLAALLPAHRTLQRTVPTAAERGHFVLRPRGLEGRGPALGLIGLVEPLARDGRDSSHSIARSAMARIHPPR